ncbi:MAG TPA: DUF4388 domain-containing protein [Candidatus Melainabacteria bacterium]|nr:DUF4388 domain-containing protein [Candidatus Melainabacteria bacterium]HIN66619.1 DUF4388 domain-containing protein [Candidatus Obscuribacterales bacterium]
MSEQQKKKQTLIDKMMKTIPTPPTAPAPSGPPEDVTTTFDGNLSEKPIAYLLRAAEHYEITGKLFIGSVHCNVCIQFGLGRAVHAISPLSVGTEAIMDLFIWKDGVIRFEPGGQPETVTVQESISDILIRGESFIGNHNFLENNYINELSFLLRPPERLAEGELENRLRLARVRDPHLHAEFYSNVYGTRNIKDTAEKMGLSHSQWVNIAADLLKLGLLLTPDNRNVKAEDPPPPVMQPPMPFQQGPPQIILPDLAPGAVSLNIPETNNLSAAPVPDIFKPAPTREIAFPVPALDEWHIDNQRPRPPVQQQHQPQPASSDGVKVGVPEEMLTLDPMMRNAIWLLLNKAETGILSFEALQFFLDREFARAFRFKSSLTLALFCVTVNPDRDGNMPAEVCSLLTEAVSNIKRDVDMFGHFGDRAFGLLLPGIESHQACVLAGRINRDLLKLKPDLAQYEPCLHFGIASAPQDATDMDALAKAAQVAMFIAALHNELLVEANQVSNKQTQQQLSQGQSPEAVGETMLLRRPTPAELSMPPQPAPAQVAQFPNSERQQQAPVPQFPMPPQQPQLAPVPQFPIPQQQQPAAQFPPQQQQTPAPQFPMPQQQHSPAPQFPTPQQQQQQQQPPPAPQFPMPQQQQSQPPTQQQPQQQPPAPQFPDPSKPQQQPPQPPQQPGEQPPPSQQQNYQW